ACLHQRITPTRATPSSTRPTTAGGRPKVYPTLARMAQLARPTAERKAAGIRGPKSKQPQPQYMTRKQAQQMRLPRVKLMETSGRRHTHARALYASLLPATEPRDAQIHGGFLG